MAKTKRSSNESRQTRGGRNGSSLPVMYRMTNSRFITKCLTSLCDPHSSKGSATPLSKLLPPESPSSRQRSAAYQISCSILKKIQTGQQQDSSAKYRIRNQLRVW